MNMGGSCHLLPPFLRPLRYFNFLTPTKDSISYQCRGCSFEPASHFWEGHSHLMCLLCNFYSNNLVTLYGQVYQLR